VYTVAEFTSAVDREFGGSVPNELRDIYNKVKERGPGPHILTGPIYVEGASPGDTLEINLIEIEPWVDYGLNLILPGMGVIPEDYPYSLDTAIPIDIKNKTASFAGVKIPVRPFFGILGVAPPGGRITSITIGTHGGNMDNKELVASSKVYLPVHVDGALFSIGDGHACQGDGEVDITALETCLRGVIQLNVIKGSKITYPMAETKENYILTAVAPDLDEALKIAVRNAIEFLVGKGFDRDEAYIFCSLSVDFRISQAVNDLRGVYAMLPKEVLKDRVKSLI
ncbi:MAG: acetamidase/formamidase family protein, partial [Methanobacteriota archaeon]